MKTPHVLASLAVATLASAADLKDPAEIAREWNEKTTPPVSLSANTLTLRDTLSLGQPQPRSAPPPVFTSPGRRTEPKAVPREPGIDAPGYRIPAEPGGKMPPGAKEWKYGGQTYWLLPAIPSRDT